MEKFKISSYKNQNYDNIKEECRKKQKPFEDELFNYDDISDHKWLRPHEICNDPQFFVGGESRFDVIQGKLGDCWLEVAMVDLTLFEPLFDRVVPKNQSFVDDYFGIFHFRLWQYGNWVDVVVDDKLPTEKGNLVYVHSADNNEFWSALLEKAYAKVYGGYKELKGGWFCESMVDFTGGMVEKVILRPPPENIEEILTESYERNSTFCVYMRKDYPGERNDITSGGLVKGHAYSITKVQRIDFKNQNILLIRIRNPWGRQEWTGPWSDSSPELKMIPDEEKKQLGLVIENDGEFWMDFSDFLDNFQNIDICHLGPSSFFYYDINMSTNHQYNDSSEIPIKTWVEHEFKGEWVANVNAGGMNPETTYLNPQFWITLEDADDRVNDPFCTLIISLMQKNKSRKVWHKIGFRAIHVDPSTEIGVLSKDYIVQRLPTPFSSPFLHSREVTERFKWPPGVYCVIPSTESPNMEAKFLLRIFTEKRSKSEDPEKLMAAAPVDVMESLTASTSIALVQGRKLEKIIYKCDHEVKCFFERLIAKTNHLGWQGLQSVLQFAMSPNLGLLTSSTDSKDLKFSKYECRILIAMLDDDDSGKLDSEEFQTLWKKMRQWESVYLQCSENSEYITAPVLKEALIRAGNRVPSSTLGSLVKRYADDAGRLTFNDFVMCAAELHTS